MAPTQFREAADPDTGAIDGAGPSETWPDLFEACVVEIVVESAVGLRSFVAEGEPNDQVDVSSADMCSGSIGKPADEVARCEAASEVDALAPRAHIAEECEQYPFTAVCCVAVVAGVVVAHQNPMISRRR